MNTPARSLRRVRRGTPDGAVPPRVAADELNACFAYIDSPECWRDELREQIAFERSCAADPEIVALERELRQVRSEGRVPHRRPAPPEVRTAVKPPLPGEIVSEDRAARALPWRRADAVAWLRVEELSVPLGRRRVVAWDRVLKRLGAGSSPRKEPARRRKRAEGGSAPLAKPGRMFD